MNNPDWDGIMAALEAWRKSFDDPAVTTIAEQHRRDPWAVLVSTILSLRTKDEVTAVSSQRTLVKAPTPQALIALPEEELERLIYPAGFYKTKAASLRKIASILIQDHGGRVPADLDTLLSFPGVGRKTANLVLTEAFDMDGICVDTHVHRICNRLGVLGSEGSKEPNQTEMILRDILPRKYWKRINLLLVLYGQRVCRPISPFCSQCVLSAHCGRRGVEKTR